MLLRHGHILVRSNRCVEFNEKAYIDIINVFHEIKYLIELKKLYGISTNQLGKHLIKLLFMMKHGMNNMIGIPSILKIFTFALFEKSSKTFLIIRYTNIPL